MILISLDMSQVYYIIFFFLLKSYVVKIILQFSFPYPGLDPVFKYLILAKLVKRGVIIPLNYE